ncbi:acetate/propionate family kinase [Pseudoteredinibacter isoporae]|uniref:Acetate kinase n=1 Tax=Pseudoteredinibacter isoporae TaxID=570281 RepID=A0A7X0MU44_9GAMM|nr:acetate/propionate family kinase [Pseudoteredinibacter isoporae]MBB6519873.1 acetate kinase [Pseudoteredinibacter isoporae]NHO85451.1 acetate/propionate family kinase [Pseudoteredinibacter isoporae]NIB26097.1 acetate/propionate family kinase [Pseudoteredinibacter isoporae]
MKTILTINAGSSSLKLGLFSMDKQALLLRLDTSDIYGDALLKIKPNGALANKLHKQKISLSDIAGPEVWQAASFDAHRYCLEYALEFIQTQLNDIVISGIGHRVVHGSEHYSSPCLLDEKHLNNLQSFIPLAPLHQPFNLKLIELCQQLCPGTAQVACFDTMFHVGQSQLERYYAIPKRYSEAGVQRYGFHGLSYQYIAGELQGLNASSSKSIVCHLGAGASMCALKDFKSAASSMGFSALEGLPMGSRTGSIDPGVLLYLQREQGLSLDELEDLLYRQSGCLGVSGISSEMKILLEQDNHADAKLAVDMFCYRSALEIARLAAVLEGLDSLVFTGGIGENSAFIREQISTRCQWLGLKIDSERNQEGELNISHADSSIDCYVIPTNEELVIAQESIQLLNAEN